MASLMLDNALSRLDTALGQLEAAARRRLEVERGRGNLETELALMQDDRARLAADLDGALAQGAALEGAVRAVDDRLAAAMAMLGEVLAEGGGDEDLGEG